MARPRTTVLGKGAYPDLWHNDEVVDLVTDVAANRWEVPDIAAALVKLVSVPPGRPAQPEAQGRARGSS